MLFKRLKCEFITEPYVKRHLSRVHIFVITRIRSGYFSIRNCTRSLQKHPICKWFDAGSVENKIYVLTYCDCFTDAKNLDKLSPNEDIAVHLNANSKWVANLLYECSNTRRDHFKVALVSSSILDCEVADINWCISLMICVNYEISM